MSELSQESSRSNKDGNRRVTVAYFSTGAQEEIEGGACYKAAEGSIDRSLGQKVQD